MSQKEFIKTKYERLKKVLIYIKNSLIYSDGNIYFTVDSSLEKKHSNWLR